MREEELNQHFRSEYEFEWTRRYQLTSASSALMVPLIAAGAAIWGLFQFLAGREDWFAIVCMIGLGIAVVSLGISAWYLTKAFHGLEYERIPIPAEIRRYAANLDRFYDEYGEDIAIAESEDRAQGLTMKRDSLPPDPVQMVAVKFVEASNHNAMVNKTRATKLHRAINFLLITFTFIALSGIGAALDSSFRHKPAHLDSPWRTTMTRDGSGSKPKDSSQEEPKKQPVPPKVPNNELTRDNQDRITRKK